jgi:hypothetical protein
MRSTCRRSARWRNAPGAGFRDLWVTENTLDHVMCLDPVVALTYAAAVTSRIRLGASVVVLAIHSPLLVAPMGDARPCQQQPRDPRRRPGTGHHYREFEVPRKGACAFRERSS